MENENVTAIMNRIKARVENYDAPNSRYTLNLDEVTDLLRVASRFPFEAFYFCFRLAYEKGRRAAFAEMKKQKKKT